eukprot:1066232-Prymnesium_polylepis.1
MARAPIFVPFAPPCLQSGVRMTPVAERQVHRLDGCIGAAGHSPDCITELAVFRRRARIWAVVAGGTSCALCRAPYRISPQLTTLTGLVVDATGLGIERSRGAHPRGVARTALDAVMTRNACATTLAVLLSWNIAISPGGAWFRLVGAKRTRVAKRADLTSLFRSKAVGVGKGTRRARNRNRRALRTKVPKRARVWLRRRRRAQPARRAWSRARHASLLFCGEAAHHPSGASIRKVGVFGSGIEAKHAARTNE